MSYDEPITLGDIFERLGLDEKIIAEFPNGKNRYFTKYSHLVESDAALPIIKPYKYDWLSKTFHVKLAKYKPGRCEEVQKSIEASKDEKLTIKPANFHYSIDPISQTKNIREWYGMLYDKYFKIKRIICNGPATIIFWYDGTKTVVKAQDEIDYEKGILYAALKKLSTKKEYDDILRAIDKVDEACKNDPIKSIRDNLFPDRHLSPEEAEEFTKEVEKPKKKVYKRHFGDSNQRCPYCGQNWIWSGKRRISFYHDGFIKFTCKNCGRKVIYTKGGKYA